MKDPTDIARGIAPCWGDGVTGPKECDEVYQCELHFRLATALREMEAKTEVKWHTYYQLKIAEYVKEADAEGYRRGVEETWAKALEELQRGTGGGAR